MMAHPMGEDNRRRDWRQVILVIAIIVIIVLAGASRR
jgi:anti-sigma-K factor RskA